MPFLTQKEDLYEKLKHKIQERAYLRTKLMFARKNHNTVLVHRLEEELHSVDKAVTELMGDLQKEIESLKSRQEKDRDFNREIQIRKREKLVEDCENG